MDKRGKKIGLEYFDLGEGAIANLSIEELEEIRKQCILPFNMLSVYTDFTHPNKEMRNESVKEAKE